MTAGWTAKRFWQAASAAPCDGGFTVLLDTRQARTPIKTPLVVPTFELAQAISTEWEAQTGKIDPASMPMTRMANSALDKVAPQFAEVAALVAAYGASDLLCYRAAAPRELVARQAADWDPVLAWAALALQAPLNVTTGIMPVTQPQRSLDALSRRVRGMTAFELAALHDLVAISGSLVLGLAVAMGHLSIESAWTLSRIDEHWQSEHWGQDEMAAKSEAWRHQGLHDAGRFLALCRSQSA